ncbi:DUF3800 domain-containing protein [Lactiplantibacillus pentosus]|uniref:DUF3800 domain-containing protein n=1 Tax=Lactiplantibacillus pentosus TaxID=1589 RepID=UPI00132F70B8|nr:DUF3800 domain-containing protein [Lactiplantibacillus pentosus]MBQ0837519.1 DUF3800 domain-containing protein [Lactiplantibacillus pentosus]
MDDWRIHPTSIENCNLSAIDYVISMDETGTPSLKNIVYDPISGRNWFTLTGSIIETSNINAISDKVMTLKKTFWPNGNFSDHRVIFHSRNIRKKEGPFNPKVINYTDFHQQLDQLIADLPIVISAASINKYYHFNLYLYPDPVYQLAISFILERLTFNLNWRGECGVIFLESRGDKEDAELLQQIVHILRFGNRKVDAQNFQCIKGVYFNKKWTKGKKKSYWPLEIADILSYRIHRHIVFGDNDLSFDTVAPKLVHYPRYQGYGLKVFPKGVNKHV